MEMVQSQSVTGDAASNVVFGPVIQQLKDVILKEGKLHTLQTELMSPMHDLLLYITTNFEILQEADHETFKIWLQLLHNSLAETKSIFHRSEPRQRCLAWLMYCNPGRLSKEIKTWKVLFNSLFEGLPEDFSVLTIRGNQVVIAPVIAPVIQLMYDVMHDVIKEENRGILLTELRPMWILLLDISAFFQDQQKVGPETLKFWLQQLHKSLTKAKTILLSEPQRQRCLDFLMSPLPVRLSTEIKEWKVLFNYLFQRLQTYSLVLISGNQVVIAPVIAPVIPLMNDVIKEEENRGILQTELKPVENLLLNISAFFQDEQKVGPETLKFWLQQLHKSLVKAKTILLSEPRQRQRCLDCLMSPLPVRLSTEIKEWKVLFNYFFQRLQTEFSIVLTATPILKSAPLRSLLQEVAEKSIAMQSLSEDEAWVLFRRIAFNNDTVSVSMDIQECAHKIAKQCKGLPLAIAVVAAAMTGKINVVDWENSLDFMKAADSSFPDTPRVDPHLYQALRLSYDALPNSSVKNCFLYCAVYPQHYGLAVERLVQLWIAEGLVGSKQESHLMDMATERYVDLFVDRFLFQNVQNKETMNFWTLVQSRWITVHPAIREMAIHIGEKEENCVFRAAQELRSFPEINNEDCKRISLCNNYIENLPTEFTCPKLVSLFLSENPIKEIPSGFLVSLTSLRVLDLSSNAGISSIPLSVGQLKQLEFLDLSNLSEIQDLPQEICHLSSLQFLYLAGCKRLQSLPSKIGQLKNLKVLMLKGCRSLTVFPHEISQLTSLSKLDAGQVELSVEAESEASIWSLKGLENLTTLNVVVKVDMKEGITSSGIKVGIMGTWLDMRHLWLTYRGYDQDDVLDNLPHDMQKMSKLQSFCMESYHGLSLPNYISKFQHLQYLVLWNCPHLRELSPLERLPNLKYLKLHRWRHLKELGIGVSGRARGFVMLEKLVLQRLRGLESIAGPSNNGVWNEALLPKLRVLKIRGCPSLKSLPNGMEKLVSLSTLCGTEEWWQNIIWQDNNMKSSLQNRFQKLKPKELRDHYG